MRTLATVAVTCAALATPATLIAQDEDRGWAFHVRSVAVLEAPDGLLSEEQRNFLEYDGDASTFRGLRLDLDGDDRLDYVVATSPSLCGNAGCNYLLISGAGYRELGLLFGNPVFGRAVWVNGHRVLNVYGRMNADAGRYATYVFDGETYVNVSTVTVSGDDLAALFDEMREIPLLPKGGLHPPDEEPLP